MARETWVQSQVESYQRLKKWYFMPLCLTLSFIRYGSTVKWGNPGKTVAPSLTPWCSSYRKRSVRVTLDYVCQRCNFSCFFFYFPFFFFLVCLELLQVLYAGSKNQSFTLSRHFWWESECLNYIRWNLIAYITKLTWKKLK